MGQDTSKPRIRYSRANIREVLRRALDVQAAAWMLDPLTTEEGTAEIMVYPTFWAPPNGANIRPIMNGYHRSPDFIDVHMSWEGLFMAHHIVLYLDYKWPINRELLIAFDLTKWGQFLRRTAAATRMFCSFQSPPKAMANKVFELSQDSDPNMITLLATDTIQAELGLLLDLWIEYQERMAHRPQNN